MRLVVDAFPIDIENNEIVNSKLKRSVFPLNNNKLEIDDRLQSCSGFKTRMH